MGDSRIGLLSIWISWLAASVAWAINVWRPQRADVVQQLDRAPPKLSIEAWTSGVCSLAWIWNRMSSSRQNSAKALIMSLEFDCTVPQASDG